MLRHDRINGVFYIDFVTPSSSRHCYILSADCSESQYAEVLLVRCAMCMFYDLQQIKMPLRAHLVL